MRGVRAACFLLFPAWSVAQEQPTIRVTTRLVQVNVIVNDRTGAPVADLKQQDFTLLDRGKPRKIASFSVDSTSASPAWPALAPNVFSNRIMRPGTPTSITVILFDVLNTPIMDQMFARQQIVKFLETIRPEDRVAIYLLTRELKVLHDFTNDSSHLVQALAKFKGRHETRESSGPDPLAPTGNDDVDAFLQGSSQSVSDFLDVNRALVTFDAMEAIAKHLAAFPGRKNLVWVSASFPFTMGFTVGAQADATKEHRIFTNEAKRVGQAMNDSNIAIYPVDARGLVSSATPVPWSRSNAENTNSTAPIITTPPNQDTMENLAERTGGHAFYNTNDLTNAVRRAMDDARVTYTLGFYPADNEWDDKFHNLKIKVARSGVDVRYRKGFVAINQPVPAAQEMSDVVKRTAASPVEARGIGINARVDIVDTPKPGALHLTLQINPDNFVLEPRNDRWAGTLEIAFVQRATDGKVVEAINRTFHMNLTNERHAEIMKTTLQVQKTIQPTGDAEQLRIVVMDHASGNVGSLQIPIRH